MNGCLAVFLLMNTFFQSTDEPKVRHLSVISNYSTEIVFKYAYPIFIENEPVKNGAIECFSSQLKSTGLLTNVQVTLKPTEDGKWVDIDITPTWDKRRKSFVISEINFEGFDGFDLAKLREAL